jgi:hypothetical protein
VERFSSRRTLPGTGLSASVRLVGPGSAGSTLNHRRLRGLAHRRRQVLAGVLSELLLPRCTIVAEGTLKRLKVGRRRMRGCATTVGVSYDASFFERCDESRVFLA